MQGTQNFAPSAVFAFIFFRTQDPDNETLVQVDPLINFVPQSTFK
jgi:hypothetical protein